MRCASCGAENADGAKFCLECGRAINSQTDEEQIERLVDYLAYDALHDDGEELDDESRRRVHDAARDVYARWKANPRLEDVEVKLGELHFTSGNDTSIDESFDAEELADIFSGREAIERAAVEAERAENQEREDVDEASRVAKRKVEEEEHDRKKASENALRKRQSLFVVGIIILIGTVFVFELVPREHEEKDKSAKTEDRHSARTTPATTTTASAIVEPPKPMAIPSCTCVSRATGKNTFVLGAPADSGPWHVKWDQVAGFSSMNSGFWIGESDAGAPIALRRGATALHAAMACENEILAVVSGDVASAWTATDSGELLWTRKLPAPYAFPADAGLGDVGCGPTLGVTGNVFSIPLAAGKTIALSIRDGSIMKK